MLQRDYILRLFREFTQAMENILKEKSKKEDPEAQQRLQSLYRAYFNHPHTFYYEQDAGYILNDLRQNHEGEEFLTRVDMLAELMYNDALLQNEAEQKYLLKKALFLLEYLDSHSDTFSFERRGKIGEIRRKTGT